MARHRYHRRVNYRSRSIGHERARLHIAAARRLTQELGGTDQDVKQYFFNLPTNEFRSILDAYGQKYGAGARDYAEKTIDKWRTGRVQMGGMVAERLFDLLPPRMPLTVKYQLVENLWKHVGPRSKKTVRIGLDAEVDQVLNTVRSHLDNVVIHYKIPADLEARFNWLAAGDSQVKQDLLNHLQQYEKALVTEGARLQLPVMFEHLRSQAGQHTHRLAQVLKIGNHELELALDKNASGVSIVEPWILARSSVGPPANYKWLWWVVAAIVIIFLFARH